jgi:hypothetical protein
MDTALDALAERLDRRDLKTAVVSTPDGALVGVVRRKELPPGEQGRRSPASRGNAL